MCNRISAVRKEKRKKKKGKEIQAHVSQAMVD